jgi:hypothetical protein
VLGKVAPVSALFFSALSACSVTGTFTGDVALDVVAIAVEAGNGRLVVVSGFAGSLCSATGL